MKRQLGCLFIADNLGIQRSFIQLKGIYPDFVWSWSVQCRFKSQPWMANATIGYIHPSSRITMVKVELCSKRSST